MTKFVTIANRPRFLWKSSALVLALFVAVSPSELHGQPQPRYVPQQYGGAPQGLPNAASGQPSTRIAANSLPMAPNSSNNGQNNGGQNIGGQNNIGANASKEAKIPVRNLLQIFHDGGWMMYPIALCSFVLTVFTFERLIHLRRGRVIPRPFVKRLIEQLQQQQIDREEALELCERNPSPMATILSAAVRKYGRPAVEVEQAVIDTGERVTNQLRRHLRLLSAISNLSPLLGLLGTVLGMIEAFNVIASTDAMGRPELLAGGIGQAMLTTAAGLFVAIPAYISYMYFLGHTDRLVMDMDAYAQQVIEAVSAEGLQENDTSRTRSRSRKAA